MTPQQEQAEKTADKAIDALRSAVDEIISLRSDLQQKTERIAELEQGANEMLAVWRNECDLRVKAQADLQRMTDERDEIDAVLTDLRAEFKYQIERGNDLEAALRQVTEELEMLMQAIKPSKADDWTVSDYAMLARAHRSDSTCVDDSSPSGDQPDYDAASRARQDKTEAAEAALRELREQIQKVVDSWRVLGADPTEGSAVREVVLGTFLECADRLSTLLGSGLLKP